MSHEDVNPCVSVLKGPSCCLPVDLTEGTQGPGQAWDPASRLCSGSEPLRKGEAVRSTSRTALVLLCLQWELLIEGRPGVSSSQPPQARALGDHPCSFPRRGEQS